MPSRCCYSIAIIETSHPQFVAIGTRVCVTFLLAHAHMRGHRSTGLDANQGEQSAVPWVFGAGGKAAVLDGNAPWWQW